MSYHIKEQWIKQVIKESTICPLCGKGPFREVDAGGKFHDLLDAQNYVHSLKHETCTGKKVEVVKPVQAGPDKMDRVIELLTEIRDRLPAPSGS